MKVDVSVYEYIDNLMSLHSNTSRKSFEIDKIDNNNIISITISFSNKTDYSIANFYTNDITTNMSIITAAENRGINKVKRQRKQDKRLVLHFIQQANSLITYNIRNFERFFWSSSDTNIAISPTSSPSLLIAEMNDYNDHNKSYNKTSGVDGEYIQVHECYIYTIYIV